MVVKKDVLLRKANIKKYEYHTYGNIYQPPPVVANSKACPCPPAGESKTNPCDSYLQELLFHKINLMITYCTFYFP